LPALAGAAIGCALAIIVALAEAPPGSLSLCWGRTFDSRRPPESCEKTQ
jgi:hypothetical protein